MLEVGIEETGGDVDIGFSKMPGEYEVKLAVDGIDTMQFLELLFRLNSEFI